MATVLDKTLKREIAIKGKPFMLAISPVGLLLTPKGRRKGVEIEWAALVSGEAAMTHALNASLHSNLAPAASPTPHKKAASGGRSRSR
jgi:hypothetical protein